MSSGQVFAVVWAVLAMGFGTFFAVFAERVADLQEKRDRRAGLGVRRRRSAAIRLNRLGAAALSRSVWPSVLRRWPAGFPEARRRVSSACQAYRVPGHEMSENARGVLGVFAHPDDESLSSGGALARAAARGRRVGVVTATWGDGTHRAAELAVALDLLRAGPPRLLGYADARVPESAPGSARLIDAPLDEAVGRLVRIMREFRPHTVLTHDPYGGITAHPDHLHTYRITVLAVEAAALPQVYPEHGVAWRTAELLLATHPESALPAIRGFLGDAGDLSALPDTEVDIALDVTEWLDTKVEAILAHTSEVTRGAAPGLIASLSEDERRLLLGTEWYVRRAERRPR